MAGTQPRKTFPLVSGWGREWGIVDDIDVRFLGKDCFLEVEVEQLVESLRGRRMIEVNRGLPVFLLARHRFVGTGRETVAARKVRDRC